MSVTADDCNKTHPNFYVACLKCKSERVIVENSLGFSPESGQWGCIALRCIDCNNETPIYGDGAEQ